MILAFAVLVGLGVGLLRARRNHVRLHAPELHFLWLVLVAFIPQFLAFQFRPTRGLIPDQWAAVALVSSEVILLVFVWLNRSQRGVLLMGAGIGLNLVVIALNGGWMPISPETVSHLLPNAAGDSWSIGSRLGFTKDWILPSEHIRLGWLSDRFLVPFIGQRIAFSLGDIVMALGIITLLWDQGIAHPHSVSAVPKLIQSISKDGCHV